MSISARTTYLIIACLASSNGETVVDSDDTNTNQRSLNDIRATSKVFGFGVDNLHDFVGFSYSRALLGRPKTRFISFEEEVSYAYIFFKCF